MKNLLKIMMILFLVSCSASPEMKFEMFGISFICPSGWKITEEENLDNEGYYLSIEKDGSNSSGLMTITWLNKKIELNKFLLAFQNKMKDNIIYKNSNLVFYKTFETKFNNKHSIASKFTANLIGVKYEGVIYSFYGMDKTILIQKLEALEDKTKNENGFEIMEKSFLCN